MKAIIFPLKNCSSNQASIESFQIKYVGSNQLPFLEWKAVTIIIFIVVHAIIVTVGADENVPIEKGPNNPVLELVSYCLLLEFLDAQSVHSLWKNRTVIRQSSANAISSYHGWEKARKKELRIIINKDHSCEKTERGKNFIPHQPAWVIWTFRSVSRSNSSPCSVV